MRELPPSIFMSFLGDSRATANYVRKAIEELGIYIETRSPENASLILNVDDCGPRVITHEGIPSFYWETDSWFPRIKKDGIEQITRIFYGGCPADSVRYPENAIYLPLATDIESHKPVSVEKEFDIVMIGRMGGEYVERQRVVDLLKTKYSVYVGEADAGHEYSKAMSKGKLILHRSVSDANIGMRFFEGMAIGCLLANYIEGMNYHATPYMHYIPFRNDNELLENVEYYLSHPEERQEMAHSARKLVAEKHTYKHRVLEMLSYL